MPQRFVRSPLGSCVCLCMCACVRACVWCEERTRKSQGGAQDLREKSQWGPQNVLRICVCVWGVRNPLRSVRERRAGWGEHTAGWGEHTLGPLPPNWKGVGQEKSALATLCGSTQCFMLPQHAHPRVDDG